MAVLVHIPSGLPSPEIELLFAKCQEIISKKKKLFIVTCLGKNNYACSLNPYGSKIICFSCKNRFANGLKNLKGNFSLIKTPEITLSDSLLSEKKISLIRNKFNLKDFFYISIDLGSAAISSYLAKTRDARFAGKLSDYSLKKLLSTGIALVKFYYNFFRENKINEIYIYNARQIQSRPLLRIANRKKIKVTVLEHNTIFRNSNNVRNFENYLPQDIGFFSKKVRNLKDFYIKKNFNNIKKYFKYRSLNKFTKKQARNLLPVNWNNNKKNIVFFTSSEDEWIALGGKYNNNYCFKNQNYAISKLTKFFDKKNSDYNLWIRVHPNLKDVRWEFNTSLKKRIKNFANVNLIDAKSKISSYEVLKQADKVVVFYSSIALEAAYINKPCILLGRTTFENLNFCYRPKSFESLKRIMFNNQLKAKDNNFLFKLIYFYTNCGIKQIFFKGNHFDGYFFNNKRIKFNIFGWISKIFGLFLEYYIYENINFYFRRIKY